MVTSPGNQCNSDYDQDSAFLDTFVRRAARHSDFGIAMLVVSLWDCQVAPCHSGVAFVVERQGVAAELRGWVGGGD
jgi:hypothetical protein